MKHAGGLGGYFRGIATGEQRKIGVLGENDRANEQAGRGRIYSFVARSISSIGSISVDPQLNR
jgi:hypothetical protein